MKIQHVASMQIHRYQPSSNGYHTSNMNHITKRDYVEISTEAKELLKETAIPEARQKKINELKQTIENGTYHVDVKEIARKMYDYYNK